MFFPKLCLALSFLLYSDCTAMPHPRRAQSNKFQVSRGGNVHEEEQCGTYSLYTDTPIGFEEMEAMVVETSSSVLFSAIVRATLSLSGSVRYMGDTTTSVLSNCLKSIGGLLNLFSGAIKELTLPLVTPYAPTDRMPDNSIRIRRKVGRVIRVMASGIYVTSTILQILGDTTESFTIGFGQSVEDSFSGLVFVMSQMQSGTKLLLHPVRRAGTIQEMVIGSEENISEKGTGWPFTDGDTDTVQEQNQVRGDNHRGNICNDTIVFSDARRTKSCDSVEMGESGEDIDLSAKEEKDKIKERYDKSRNINRMQIRLDRDSNQVNSVRYVANSFEEGNALRNGSESSLFLLSSHFFIIFLFLMMISFHPMGRNKKIFLLSTGLLFLMVLLRFAEKNQKSRLYTQSTVRSISRYLQNQVKENNKSLHVSHNRYSNDERSDEMSNEKFPMFDDGARERYEASIWANAFISAIWTTTRANPHSKAESSSHGFGAYMDSTMFGIISDELRQIPEGLNKFSLKKFNFGSEPPFIKAIRCKTRREEVCLNQMTHEKEHRDKYSANFSSSCTHVVVDVDFAYASKEMDTIFTFRSDEIKSLLPEASITFSEVLLEGLFRIDAELTPTYPFLGNATMAFLNLPVLDVTIGVGQGFSNIDVANIPGVYNFLNNTFTWVLSQYTYPKSGSIDLRRTLCPSCDTVELKSDQSPTIDSLPSFLRDMIRGKTKRNAKVL